MFTPDQYELLDFGEGRKLERFGGRLVDRPAAANEPKAQLAAWKDADLRFERSGPDAGEWTVGPGLPPSHPVSHGLLRFELKPTASGQVGLFPEQAENWDWLAERLGASQLPAVSGGTGVLPVLEDTGDTPVPPPRVLNLFAYTGGSTLAAAAAGAAVTHVDAAESAVAWARRNAELSALQDAPVRWIVEDAVRFVQRELRRGAQYDAVILDPPSYGHGRKGQPWKLDQDLPSLVDQCVRLLGPAPRLVLLTCHSPGWPAERLGEVLSANLRGHQGPLETQEAVLSDRAGRRLPSGAVARWTCNG